ncbi:AAA family ATPase [Vannielia litorea]|uniref:Primase C terminal 2 (PriCT-2) n=1 Tax=Vannielia litorea TaxID=1217970 RepID=A0A1N6FV09_9RHOB|nr:AAA family ATPase [Vannielia litorea]SIN99083.1 Primase C terminal 2 (PriCT-2) [Vannielia litorea]
MEQARTRTQNPETARKLARDGFKIFPCDPATKRPLVRWRDKATDDPVKVARWWSKWPDAMPGLPTGEANGLSVVDLDVGKGKDGLAAARAIGITPGDADLVVRTGGGGLHLFFEHVEGVTNSASAEGLDVRGEGGYVIAPGAVSRSGEYRCERGSLGAARLLGLSPFPSALRRRARPADEPSAPAGGHDIAELRDALRFIPNNGSYDEWVSTLMALHHGSAGSPDGLALALGWSAGHPGFSHAEVREKWRSFGKADGLLVTADSLFAEAKRHGWQGVDADDFDDLPDEVEAPSDEIAALLDMTPEKPAAKDGLTFLSPADCAASNPRPYVIKGLIAKRDVGCIVGAPGVGKSVLAPALGYAVAQGREAHGRRTKAGGVFYVAAEDEHGMRGRVTALKAEHGDAPNFTLVGGVSDLLNPEAGAKWAAQVRTLAKAVKEKRPTLIVIDTLAMAFPGLEENSAEGMGRVVAVARALTKWGAAVILVHHDTKDGQQGLPRGHSLLNGALDVSIHLRKGESGVVTGRLTKNRNGSCDGDLAFRIRGEEIGTDEDGDPITTALCDPCDPAPGGSTPRLKPTEAAALGLIMEMVGEGESVSRDEWLARAASPDELRVTTAEDADNRRRAARRILGRLADKEHVTISDGHIRLTQIGGDDWFDDLEEDEADHADE